MSKTLEERTREMTDKAFADHAITERCRQGVFRSWRCKRTKSWVYGFDITTTPGFIFITGDIGDLIVEREYDMLPWCRSACESIDYFAKKVPHAIPTTQFDEAKVLEWVAEELKNEELSDEDRELLEDAAEGGLDELGESEVYAILQPVWQDDPPSWREWTSNFLWCRDAIRWFVNHIDEPEVLQPKRGVGMWHETITHTETYKMFDVGVLVSPTSNRSPLESGKYRVTSCTPPRFPGDSSTIFVEGRLTGLSTEYLQLAPPEVKSATP